jgi:hypothetical protein
MPDPLRLAAAAVELGIAQYGRRGSQRATASIALVVGGVACASGGAGFAVAAFLMYLIPIVGAPGAAFVVAGTLMALAGATLGVSEYLARHRRAPAPPNLASLTAAAEDFVRENKAPVLLAAFIAGLLAANDGSRSSQPSEDSPRRNPS